MAFVFGTKAHSELPDAALSEEAKEKADRKSAIYKTVSIFSDLTKRVLWVRDGAPARTDGREIIVPFEDDDAYLLTEHEISHVLFKSNVQAKLLFVQKFVERIIKQAESTKVDLMNPVDGKKPKRGGVVFATYGRLEALVDGIVQLLEDYRVESLWGVIYPGSFRLRTEMGRRIVREMDEKNNGPQTVLQAMCFPMVGMRVPEGRFKRFEPIFIEGFKMVRRRGFPATFVAARFLIAALVDELLSEAEKQEGDDELVQEDLIFLLSTSWEEGDDAQQGSSSGAYRPPPGVNRLPKDRTEALKKILDDFCDEPLDRVAGKSDLELSQFQSRWDRDQANDMADKVLRIMLQDANSTSDFLRKTERQMKEIIDTARQALFKQLTPDEVLQKNAMARVVIHNASSSCGGDPLSLEEREAVKRLNSVFLRTLGRVRATLDSSGVEVDVDSCIQNRVTGRADPCFRKEELGRGFRGLLVVDRSGSMIHPEKKIGSEQACRIIGAALALPFVKFEVWGFQSLNDGQIDVTKFGRTVRSLDDRGSGEIGGVTPLHTAVRLGIRQLMSEGSDAKHLFVVTDGLPEYSTRTGRVSTKALVRFVREEVLFGRKNGVNTIGVIIGEDLEDKVMQYMFGRREFWKRISLRTMQTDLVQLVASSFVRYLRNK